MSKCIGIDWLDCGCIWGNRADVVIVYYGDALNFEIFIHINYTKKYSSANMNGMESEN